MGDQERRGLMYDSDKVTKKFNGGDKGHMKNQVPYGSLFFFMFE